MLSKAKIHKTHQIFALGILLVYIFKMRLNLPQCWCATFCILCPKHSHRISSLSSCYARFFFFLVDFYFLFQNVNPIPSAFVVTHMLPGDRRHTEQFQTESGHGSFTICSAGWSVWSLLPLPWESALRHL